MKLLQSSFAALTFAALTLAASAGTTMAASQFSTGVEATIQEDVPGSASSPTFVSWAIENDASTVVLTSSNNLFRIAVPKTAFSKMVQGVMDSVEECGGGVGAVTNFETPIADNSVDKITISAVPGIAKEACYIQFSSKKLKRHVNIGVSDAAFLMMNLSKALTGSLGDANRAAEASPN